MGENRELETLVELCLQRKQSNYADLKAWDETRAKRLELHLKTAEQVIDYIDVSVKQSDKYLNGIEQFLESKADQYRLYTNGTVITPSLYCYDTESSRGVEQTASLAGKHQTTVAEVHNIITSNLLEKVRGNLNSSNTLVRIRESISDQMEGLRDKVEQASRKCSKLSTSYHKQKSQSNSFRCRVDLYARQEAFILSARQQTELQRKLGILTTKYLESAIEFQISRHQVIKEVLCGYYKVLMLIDCELPDGIMQTVNKESAEELINTQLYCPSSIIEEGLHAEIKGVVVKPEATDKPLRLAELKVYLSCLEFEQFSPRNLILKQTRTMLTLHEQTPIPSVIRLTIDGFLHFYLGKQHLQQNSYRSDMFIKASKCKFSHPEDATLKIQCSSEVHSKDKDKDFSSIFLVFSAEDSKLEFCEFLESVCNQ